MVLVNLPQLLVDSILTGSILALGAIGLTLVYRVMKFPNFVHAEFMTFGAYSAYAANQYLGLGLFAGSISYFIEHMTQILIFISKYELNNPYILTRIMICLNRGRFLLCFRHSFIRHRKFFVLCAGERSRGLFTRKLSLVRAPASIVQQGRYS